MRLPALIFVLLLLLTAGCSSRQEPAELPSVTMTISPEPLSTPIPKPLPETTVTTLPPTTVKTRPTATPRPLPTLISEDALKARVVDARNKLMNLIDSDMADTVITHPSDAPGCDVKKSKEIGYLIDATTGESTFVKGDYWSIDAALFQKSMRKDHQYVIIHTHPRMWVTCRGSGVVSLYTFSIGDLEATANLTTRGYHVKYLIAIADEEYRIWPKIPDAWKSPQEIHLAIVRIEKRLDTPFSYYDPALDHEFYEVDSLMPLLAKELNYSYTANNDVIS